LLANLQNDFYPQALQAVLKKYMHFCKTQHIDEIIRWRLTYFKMKITSTLLKIVFKMCLSQIKAEQMRYCNFRDENTKEFISDMSHYTGLRKVEKIFPLLNPSLSNNQCKNRH